MKIVINLAAVLVLVGCGAAPLKPLEVKVPVAVGCLGEIPARPVPAFGTGAYPGEKPAAQAALVDAAAWERYAIRLEATIAGCDKKAAMSK
ncbi:MAG: hypothetical protein WA191_20715 [Telluria sp.]